MEMGDMGSLLVHLHTSTTVVWISFGRCPNACKLFGLEILFCP